jgi:hypothetical protein
MGLLLWGIRVVPTTIATLDGIGALLATLGLQVVLAFLALYGPLSFQRYRSAIWISLLIGLLFAIAYDGILLLNFLGIYEDVNVYLFFVGAASLAGFIAGYRTRQFSQGVIAAIWALVIGTAIWSVGVLLLNYAWWGTLQWYTYWQNDGAIEDFQHSGMTDLNVFLIRDTQGALFFHPLLSAGTGAICGLVTSSSAQGVLRLWKNRSNHMTSEPDGVAERK